ncbi:hypothetical protein C0991_000624 [Blastosporella zonata]|nr:hypothetical protein C0991_000624 [Blastosporella zonata]
MPQTEVRPVTNTIRHRDHASKYDGSRGTVVEQFRLARGRKTGADLETEVEVLKPVYVYDIQVGARPRFLELLGSVQENRKH